MFILTTQSQLKTKDIIQFISQGNNLEKCVAFLYRDNFELIETMVLKMNGSKSDAEDVFKYSLSKVLWLIQEGKIDEEIELKTYIYTFSRTLWVNTLKKKNNYTYYTSDSYHENFNPQLLEEFMFEDDDLYIHREFSEAYASNTPIDVESEESLQKLSDYLNSVISKLII
ncbi:RNA polymerase sigma factor [Flammeovirga aprica]|uniref:Sigma-70 family RNA polymerase sigma factor n=1 Tax=Flammeovirga aprica JL-4 TaxID=694437 RepID=A0A7X9RUK4_9BACT|nr:hypothetical protein [Flammeovirga aprica]NME68989.1 hypothetical protein [Flammeovirga aprica JL-4]